jgi:hypothetical protein
VENAGSLHAVPPKPWGIIATVLWAVLALFISGIASAAALTWPEEENSAGRTS